MDSADDGSGYSAPATFGAGEGVDIWGVSGYTASAEGRGVAVRYFIDRDVEFMYPATIEFLDLDKIMNRKNLG